MPSRTSVNTPSRTQSAGLDERFCIFQAMMEKRREEYDQCIESLLQHVDKLKWENEELWVQVDTRRHSSKRSRCSTSWTISGLSRSKAIGIPPLDREPSLQKDDEPRLVIPFYHLWCKDLRWSNWLAGTSQMKLLIPPRKSTLKSLHKVSTQPPS